MPFAVWCTTCKPHETLIGQGVRFNAEKKKVGNYYSTPIYSFRMKHTACGGWIEIRTDPKNTAYVVVEGGRKRDTGEDKELQPGEIAIRPPGVRTEDPAEKDPFAKIEGKVTDKRRADTETSRILELQKRQNRDWDDPYEKSRRLRRTFRAERKGLEKAEANREALKDKMSLGIDLVDETEEDRRRAGMVDFGDDHSTVSAGATRVTRVRPMFKQRLAKAPSDADLRHKGKQGGLGPRTASLISQRKAALRHELTGNTRAVVDPFLAAGVDDEGAWQPSTKKRKVVSSMTPEKSGNGNNEALDEGSAHCNTELRSASEISATTPTTPALVSYTSDTD